MADGIPVLWERHLQSGMLGLLAIATVAMATASITAKEDIAVVKNDVRYIQSQLTTNLSNQWTAADQRAYRAYDALRAESIRKDVERNTQRIKEIEDSHGGSD